MSDRRIPVTLRIDRAVYFQFKRLALSHGVAVEKAAEEAMRQALRGAGVAIEEESELSEGHRAG